MKGTFGTQNGISLFGKLTQVIFIFLLILLLLTACKLTRNETVNRDVQIRTDTEPIYNQFPSFPYTEEIEWYSNTSDGIGLLKTDIYVFAYYANSEDLKEFLDTVTLADTASDIGDVYISKDAMQDNTWQKILELPFAFQDGIPTAKLINTDVYINSNHTIVYMHAIGE